jgi:hypothetical protein
VSFTFIVTTSTLHSYDRNVIAVVVVVVVVAVVVVVLIIVLLIAVYSDPEITKTRN